VFRREGLFFALRSFEPGADQTAPSLPSYGASFAGGGRDPITRSIQHCFSERAGKGGPQNYSGPQNSEASTHLAYIKILACCDISRYL